VQPAGTISAWDELGEVVFGDSIADLGPAGLLARFEKLELERRLIEAELVQVLAQAHDSGAFRDDQHTSIKGWARALGNWSDAGALHRARTVRLCRELPSESGATHTATGTPTDPTAPRSTTQPSDDSSNDRGSSVRKEFLETTFDRRTTGYRAHGAYEAPIEERPQLLTPPRKLEGVLASSLRFPLGSAARCAPDRGVVAGRAARTPATPTSGSPGRPVPSPD
jgi:hypothetical protein